MEIDEPSEYIDLLDPLFNQFIAASNVVDLCVSPLQYDGTFRKETFGMDSINDASETRDIGTTSSTANNQNNSMTGVANDSPHEDACKCQLWRFSTDTNVAREHDQSNQPAHLDSFSDFNVELDMDWVNNISRANSVIEHTLHGADEFVPSAEFFTECVNMGSIRCSSYGFDNEADLNEFGKIDETVVVVCSPNNVENDQTCEASMVVDVSCTSSVSHETNKKQQNENVEAAIDNLENGFKVVAPGKASDIMDMDIVDSSFVRRSVEDFLSENPCGSNDSTLNGVVHFLENREDEGVDSTVTYLINPK